MDMNQCFLNFFSFSLFSSSFLTTVVYESFVNLFIFPRVLGAGDDNTPGRGGDSHVAPISSDSTTPQNHHTLAQGRSTALSLTHTEYITIFSFILWYN